MDKVTSESFILKIENLSLYFGGLKAVNDLSFNVKEGDIVGLIGPNGAGKTTVFNCLTRFYDHYTGNIYYQTEANEMIDLRTLKTDQVVQHKIARTFQNIELVPDLSVIDNVLIGAHKFVKTNIFDHILKLPRLWKQEKDLNERALKILTFLKINHLKDFYVAGLPYGIQKRIELARALITEPRLLILDEPAAGLNEQETDELQSVIRKIRDEMNTTILLIEHDMSFVMGLCNSVCAINFGRFLAMDKPEAIKKHPLVQEAYLGKDEQDE